MMWTFSNGYSVQDQPACENAGATITSTTLMHNDGTGSTRIHQHAGRFAPSSNAACIANPAASSVPSVPNEQPAPGDAQDYLSGPHWAEFSGAVHGAWPGLKRLENVQAKVLHPNQPPRESLAMVSTIYQHNSLLQW